MIGIVNLALQRPDTSSLGRYVYVMPVTSSAALSPFVETG
jgi:hypothetical protein